MEEKSKGKGKYIIIILLVGSLLFSSLAPGFFMFMAAASLLLSEDEVELSLYCSPTGDYNYDAIDRAFAKRIDRDSDGDKDVIRPAGALTDKQDIFIEKAEKYKIDAVLLMAIALHETGRGTSSAVREKNNPGGLMKRNKLMEFETIEKGIESMAKTLYNRMVRDGNNTIMELWHVYAPVGASNDPNNLNSHWITGVTQFVSELGGVKNCDLLGDGLLVEGSGNFVVPTTTGFRVTSEFGYRIHPKTGLEDFHQGIDLACTVNSPIIAASSGEVVYAEDRRNNWSTSYGNYVIVKHDEIYSTLYAHLNSVDVEVGETVETGKIIGACGTTGTVTAEHLHFEIRRNGNYIDPYPYLLGTNEMSDV